VSRRTRASSGELPSAARLLGRRLLHFDAESGTASLEFLAKPEFANRHHTVQGGILAAMLDSATGATMMASLPAELTAVTVQLNTTFLKPAPIGPLCAAARIVRKDDRDATVEAEITSPDGEVVVRGSAQLRILRRK
jgi:uncharacterized protein (TIGR00369 family)